MEPIWTPSPERVKSANITRFIECLNARKNLTLAGHAELYAWSLEHPGEFWSELARFADVRIDWGEMTRGAFSAVSYAAVFFATAVWRFGRKDITS